MAMSASQIRSPFFRNPALSLTSKSSLSAFLVTLASRRQAPPQLVVVLSAANLDTKPIVLISEKLGEPRINLLKQFANVECSYNLSPDEFCTKILFYDALFMHSETKVTHEVFESSGGRLKVVGRVGVGIDNMDMAAATKFGCSVVNAPTANTVVAAEHGICEIQSPKIYI